MGTMRFGPLWLFLALGCASAPSDIPDEVSQGVTLSAAIRRSSCYDTSAARGLSLQLVAEIRCLAPSALRKVENSGVLVFEDNAFPYLQPAAADALERAALASGSIQILSGLRTLPQQLMLHKMSRSGGGRCKLPASAPGRSAHEGGLAVDVKSAATRAMRQSLAQESFEWLGSKDPVHYTFRGSTPYHLATLSVLAFQKLYNRAHPEARLAEDGRFGPGTQNALLRSPAAGFPNLAPCEPGGTTLPEGPTPIETSDETSASEVDESSENQETSEQTGVGEGPDTGER